MIFDIGRVNKVSPYEVYWEGEGNALLFCTQSGCEYEVAFIRDCKVLDGLETYQFSFKPIYGKGGYDANIKVVIRCIIDEFLSANESAIIYVARADEIDARCRNRLFLQWFSHAEAQNGGRYIIKIIGDRAGLIICRNNPLLAEYIEAAEELNATLEK